MTRAQGEIHLLLFARLILVCESILAEFVHLPLSLSVLKEHEKYSQELEIQIRSLISGLNICERLQVLRQEAK